MDTSTISSAERERASSDGNLQAGTPSGVFFGLLIQPIMHDITAFRDEIAVP